MVGRDLAIAAYAYAPVWAVRRAVSPAVTVVRVAERAGAKNLHFRW